MTRPANPEQARWQGDAHERPLTAPVPGHPSAAKERPTSDSAACRHGSVREQILDHANWSFNQFGYHATTMATLAAAVGMTKGNLYHYFQDKESILYACHVRGLCQRERSVTLIVRSADGPTQKIRRLIEVELQQAGEDGGSELELQIEPLSEDHRRDVSARRGAFKTMVTRIIAEGVQGGTFRNIDPELGSHLVLGALHWTSNSPSRFHGSDDQALSRKLTELVLGGLSTQEVSS